MTYTELWHRLTPLYDSNEAKAIVRIVLEERFGLSVTDIYTGKVTQLSAHAVAELRKIMTRLEQAEPVQYVLGKACFYGCSFTVSQGVLIPRPETEDLCTWVIETVLSSFSCHEPCLLDIGTGSGCIAATLALNIPHAHLSAWDISPEALAVARANVKALKASVDVAEVDVLNLPSDSDRWEIIVSNPPYICRKEKADMEDNVVCYEPAEALFVPDDDPLLFYRAIARYAFSALRVGGMLFFEINPLYVQSLETLLCETGFKDTELKLDRFGRQRFIKVMR